MRWNRSKIQVSVNERWLSALKKCTAIHFHLNFCFSLPSGSLNFRRVFKIERSLTIFYLFAVLFTAIALLLTPIILNIFSSEFHPILPVKSAFIYDINQPLAYALTYLLYCYIIHVTAFVSVSSSFSFSHLLSSNRNNKEINKFCLFTTLLRLALIRFFSYHV